MDIEPYSAEQKRHVREVQDLWARYAPLMAESRDLVGGMQWKTIRGREYLYRYAPDPVTKKKRSTSLGPRTAEIEAIYARFMERRTLVKLDLPPLEEAVSTQARVSKALRLGRLPRATGEFLGKLGNSGLGAHLVVTSELAMFGYETVFTREFPSIETPALQFMLLDDAIAVDLLTELASAFPGVTSRQHRSGKIALAYEDIHFEIWSRADFMGELEHQGEYDQVYCIGERLEGDPIATFTFDRSGRPVPLSVPDPIAFSMMATVRGGIDAELGPTLARLATRSGRFELEDLEIETFPELAAHLDLGPRL
ncbi:hypothetical protein [Devosia sp.]|uniref:hypothetical protein n=1 Tax=Devosia sp. TaxID=1871048 RepID=UPI002621F95D|nr:hypothetical protein [Devosia sp.]